MYYKFFYAFLLIFIPIYYLNQNAIFMDILIGFFTTEYAAWFRSLGGFVNTSTYASVNEVVYALLNKWYYFLYTGGLLALIWGILSWIINFEFVLKKKPQYEKIKEEAEQQK